jgi:hypothetical protein
MAASLSGCLDTEKSSPDGTTGTDPNSAPVLEADAPASDTIVAGQLLRFRPTATDADGDPLTFSIENQPSWTTFNSSTGEVTGTPTMAEVGSYDGIRISVSDSRRTTWGRRWRIAVQPTTSDPTPPANTAPTISGSPPTSVRVNQSYSFQPSAADADGNALTFSISGKPSWATFNTGTGALTGTPTAAGTFSNIVITVSDGTAQTSLAGFTITVAANRAPTISGSPGTSVLQDQAYSFRPNASDPDSDALTYKIASRPAWATFNTATGQLSGTPRLADVGTYYNIVISVTDGQAETALPSFNLSVQATNRAPTISGSPQVSAKVGQAYSFRPTASDPDGNTLTFSVSGKPAWASFSTSTGQLSGTPAAGDVGDFTNIRISVSDGSLSASLSAFAINVAQAATGSATVSWTPPTDRSDGSPLTNLAGFRIYYGTSIDNYPNRVTINNPGLTSYVVSDLPAGTYYFVATAYDADGVESGYSVAASKTIQ